MNQSKEIRSLTGIRGIAALYVAIYHNLEIKTFAPTFGWQVFLNHGYISVDLFFILSGFVMTLSSKKYFEKEVTISNYLSFMKKRFARIYPMYFFVLVVGFVFLNHFDGRINFLIGLTMLSILFAPGYVLLHMWSLSTEWVAYLIFPLLFKIGTKYNKLVWYLLIIAIAIILIYLAFGLNAFLLPVNGDFAIFGLPSLTKCFAEYLLGIVTFYIVKDVQKLSLLQNLLSVVSLILIIVLLFFKTTDLLIIILFVILIGCLANDKCWAGLLMASRFMYFLGIVSYSFYLIHPIFLHYFKFSLFRNYGILHNRSLIFNLLYVSVMMTISYITFKFIELPMQKLITKKVKFNSIKRYFT